MVHEKLDLIVTPDNTLRCWKDEDELEHAASLGVLDADEVRAKRSWGSGTAASSPAAYATTSHVSSCSNCSAACSPPP